MKTIGIARPLDGLGRVVIPMELRRTMHLPEGTMMEVVPDPNRDAILLRPQRLQCVCCGSRNEPALREKNGVLVCLSCLDSMLGDIPASAKKTAPDAVTSKGGR